MGHRLTPKAEMDLRNIYFESADKFGVRAAEHYVEQLSRSMRLLASQPRMARERKEVRNSVRAHPVGSHLILYQLDGPDILVIRIPHGREDWQNDEDL